MQKYTKSYMEIYKKKGKIIRIEFNKKIFITLLILIAILILLILYLKANWHENVKNNPVCLTDSDCVPNGCCHPSSCVVKEKAPICKDLICTMDCSGPLDCGAGTCGCNKGNCEIIS